MDKLSDFLKAFDNNVIHVGYNVTKEYKENGGCIPTSPETNKKCRSVLLIYHNDEQPTLVAVP